MGVIESHCGHAKLLSGAATIARAPKSSTARISATPLDRRRVP
jgi:hypothetical protein